MNTTKSVHLGLTYSAFKQYPPFDLPRVLTNLLQKCLVYWLESVSLKTAYVRIKCQWSPFDFNSDETFVRCVSTHRRLLLCKWGALQYFRLCFSSWCQHFPGSLRARTSFSPINTSGRRGLLPPSSLRAWECQRLCNSVLHTHCVLVKLLHTHACARTPF